MAPKDETPAERKARYGRIGTASAKTIMNMLAGTASGDRLAGRGAGGETIGKNECTECSRQFACAECGDQFPGNGWDGIDAHWRAKHEKIMPYEAWPLIKSSTYYFGHPSRRRDE
jgi:hypothetical protein